MTSYQSHVDGLTQSKMLFTFVVTLLLHISTCIAGDSCPPKTALSSCTCNYLLSRNTSDGLSPAVTSPAPVTTPSLRPERDIRDSIPLPTVNNSFYTVVDCKRPKTIEALQETVSSALHRKLIDKLVISNLPPIKEHTLSRLPSGWLKNVRVRQFEVTNSRLSGDFIWYGNPFEGQSHSLLWFAANQCFLTGMLDHDTPGTVHSKGLRALPLIQGVNFSDNYLTFVSDTAFRYPPANLSTVILSRNSIQGVQRCAFQYIPLLRHIDLSHNLLDSLARTIFPSPAKHLEHIDLSWNSLTTLAADFFANMPSLRIVNLSNNFLYSMPEKPWSLVWRQLEYLNVANNFIECNCDLMWLLSILSPSENTTTSTTSPPTTSPPRIPDGQNIFGYCSKIVQPGFFASKHDLVTLQRDHLSC